jgi:hypothetical protein
MALMVQKEALVIRAMTALTVQMVRAKIATKYLLVILLHMLSIA